MQSIEIFPPGHYYVHKNAHAKDSTPIMERYYAPKWFDGVTTNTEDVSLPLLKQTFENAVKKKLMSDVPLGVFLSGGLDSSLVAATIRKLLGKDAELHSFSVGVMDEKTQETTSPDIVAARKVAKLLNTTHHEKLYTIQEGLAQIEKVIYHIESYDVTTVCYINWFNRFAGSC